MKLRKYNTLLRSIDGIVKLYKLSKKDSKKKDEKK